MKSPRTELRNLDMLDWFDEDERHGCESCGVRAAVTCPGAPASFCLACGAITVDGRRINPAAATLAQTRDPAPA
jgi:hypothetical protein